MQCNPSNIVCISIYFIIIFPGNCTGFSHGLSFLQRNIVFTGKRTFSQDSCPCVLLDLTFPGRTDMHMHTYVCFAVSKLFSKRDYYIIM